MGEAPRYAGFWLRLAAFLIDNLLLLVILAPLNSLFTSGDYFLASEASGLAKLGDLDWPFLLLNELLPPLLAIFFWVRYSATPGKQLLDCHVVDARTLQPLSIRQALLRYLGYLVSFATLGLGFLWIAIDRQRRGFHDLIAGSVVVVREGDTLRGDESQKSLAQLMKEST